MDNCPLEGLSAGERGPTRHVFFEYRIQKEEGTKAAGDKGGDGDGDCAWAKSVVTKMLNDWCSVCKLYRHAVELDAYLKG